jgi:glycosyltransferase involved in cell wall biosynthesis
MRLDRYDALSGWTYRSEAWLARRADLIIANASAVRRDATARGLPSDRVAVVPNGIDTDAMRPDREAGIAFRRRWGLPSDAFVIGCAARLDPMKDHANLLAAAARFVEKDPAARFVCVGDGPVGCREELQRQARRLGLADRVTWTGELADVRAAYNAFDIATLASAFGEGFPNTVGEAMACGIPVVATDVGDVRPIAGDAGEVVAAASPELLCEAWSRLRDRLRREPGIRDRVRHEVVARYGIEAMVGRTEEILLQLVKGRRASEIANRFS